MKPRYKITNCLAPNFWSSLCWKCHVEEPFAVEHPVPDDHRVAREEQPEIDRMPLAQCDHQGSHVDADTDDLEPPKKIDVTSVHGRQKIYHGSCSGSSLAHFEAVTCCRCRARSRACAPVRAACVRRSSTDSRPRSSVRACSIF